MLSAPGCRRPRRRAPQTASGRRKRCLRCDCSSSKSNILRGEQMKQLVVIGTSAGGLEALRTLVAALPVDFPAALCVVMHTAPQSPGVLHEILGRSGRLPAISPQSAERLLPGRVYVAPPDMHLLVEPGRVRLSKGP